MKKWFLIVLLAAAFPAFAQYARYNGSCSQGGTQAQTQGMKSTNYQLSNFPSCQVNVYLHGTVTRAAIYSDSLGTPLANPFTAGSNGLFGFNVASGRYDVSLAAPGMVTTTYPDIPLNDVGTNAYVKLAPSSNQAVIQPSATNLDVNTSGGGQFRYNGSEILTASNYPPSSAFVQVNPSSVQTVLKPLRVTYLMLPLTSVTGFGDSNMNAYGLSNPANGWFQRLGTYMNWTLNNKAISGGMCGDDGPIAFTETPVSGSNYNINLYYNDMRVNGTNATKVLESHACMVAMMAKLAIPNSQFVSAQTPQAVSGLPGCLYTGTWTNATLTGTGFSIPEKYSTVNGSTITCVTPPGQTAYVFMIHQAGNTSNQFTVSVDGVQQPCNPGENVCYDDHTWTEFATSATYLGQQFWPLGIRMANLPSGNDYHTVAITAVNTGASGMHVLGVSAASSASGGQLMPQVMLAQVPRMNAAGYAAGFIGSNASLALYNEHAHTIASQGAQDGLQVRTIDLSAAEVLDPNDPANMQSDQVHFSDIGHGRIFNAYLGEYSPLLYSRDRGAGMQFRNVTPHKNALYVGGVPSGASSGEVGSTTGVLKGRITLGGDHCGISRESSTVYQVGGGCSAGITLFQFGGNTAGFPAIQLNPSGTAELRAESSDLSTLIPITGKNIFLATTPVTFTGIGSGLTSVTCNTGYTCNSKGGTINIVSNTYTTGTIANIVWPATLGGQNCMISQNGGSTWLGFSSTPAGSTGFTLTNAVSIVGTTQYVTYACVPLF